MSGIAGIIRLDGAPVASAEIDAMLAPMEQRGPDRRQSLCVGNAGFGQVLLATTPEALAEIQPWVHPETGCVIVSDSRLDNRPELLRELQIDRPTDEVGDGELLHAAWQRWGNACVDHLLGDFALVLWDSHKRILFCARDHLGVRPFYYHHSPGRLFAFASDTRALLTLPQVPRQLDEGRVADALLGEMEGFDKTSSMFRAIVRLPSAHCLSLRDGTPELHEFWTPIGRPPFNHHATEQEWIEGLEAHLVESVRCRLRSHVPIASMLSGGLDSSAIVAIASEQLSAEDRGPLPTFSAVSNKPDCAETRAVELMLQKFPLRGTRIDFSNIAECLDRIAAGWPELGEPFDASMTMIDCQYMAASDQDIRVVLDGIDADTLLSEGDYLARLARSGRWLRLWHESRESARFLHDLYSPWDWLRPALSGGLLPPALRSKLHRWRSGAEHPPALLAPGFAERIRLSARRRAHANVLAVERARNDRKGASTACGSSYLSAGIERYGRVASRRGIEPRHPFLDRRLVEYCAWLPPKLRLRDGYPKWALRKALTHRLPEAITWRRGKEHLGWDFNQALMQRLPPLPEPACGPGDPLSRYLDPTSISMPWLPSDPLEADSFPEQIFTIMALKAWLENNQESPAPSKMLKIQVDV